jgi:hypothetical protein
MAAPKSKMTNAHKEALAVGRQEGRVVREYLESIESNRPKRGRKRTTDSVKKRLAAIDAAITNANPLQRLHLVQERFDLQKELEGMGAATDRAALEGDFAKVAAGYGQRKGISYSAWRELGVSPDVLKKAGIGRGA